MRKAYSEDRATEGGFESAANITHTDSPTSVVNAFLNLNISLTMGNIILTQEDDKTAAYHDCVEGLEESLADDK